MLTEEQLKQLDDIFKFKIGEIVVPVGVVDKGGYGAQRFVIHERWIQQCEGGAQRMYRIYGIQIDGNFVDFGLPVKESFLKSSEAFSEPERK